MGEIHEAPSYKFISTRVRSSRHQTRPLRQHVRRECRQQIHVSHALVSLLPNGNERDTGCTRACCAGGGPPGTKSLSERCASAAALAWRASGARPSAQALLMQDTWTARRGYTPELNGQVGVACPRRQGTALPGPGWTRASHVQCACVRLD